MEVIDFLKEAHRMCKSYADCKGCPLVNSPCGFIRCIVDHSGAEMRCVTKVVEQWSKEHPIITNAQKFEEVFGWPQSDIDSLRYARSWWDEPYKEPGGRNEG